MIAGRHRGVTHDDTLVESRSKRSNQNTSRMAIPRRRGRPSPPPLDQFEWDFRSLVDDEASACRDYEYARQLPQVLQDAQALRQGQNLSQIAGLLKQLAEMDRIAGIQSSSAAAYLSEDFPVIPWLRIPPERRRAILQSLPQPAARTFHPIAEHDLKKFERSEDELELLGDDVPIDYYAVVKLEWNRSDRELKADFARFLAHRTSPHTKHGGRTSPRDALNALGAYRLRQHYGTAERAIEALQKIRSVAPLYTDERSLRNAARNARQIISGLQNRR